MKVLRLIGWATVLSVAPSLLLARLHPLGDAGLYTGHAVASRDAASRAAIQAIPQQPSIPADVRATLNAKCADCHSSHTKAPLYGRFAPVSWLLERDIVAARKHMNLSDWASYTPEQQDTLKSKIVQQARSGKMPPLQYRLIHRSSAITPADIAALTVWVHGSAPGRSTAEAVIPGDPTRGQAVFEKRCTGCHTLATDREGPKLQGIYGRPTAAIAGFPYSSALLHVHGVWNDQSLDRWLTEPNSFAPNSNMDFRVPKAQDRRDLIAYFASIRVSKQ